MNERLKHNRPAELSDQLDDGTDESRITTAVFVLLCAIAAGATIAYGAVDVWATGLLAVICAVLVILWLGDTWKRKEFRFSNNRLQLPIIGFLIIGCVQLLPLGGTDLSSNVLDVDAAKSLSLDPYATRLFLVRLIVQLIFFAAALTFINSNSRLRKTALFIIIFGGVMAFFAILQQLADPEAIYGLRRSNNAIPFGPFINRHHFAAFMELTSGIALALILDSTVKRDKKLLLGIAAFLMFIAAILTSSRGGMLSIAGVAGFVFAAKYFSKTEGSNKKSGLPRRLWATAGTVAAFLILIGTVVFLGGGDELMRGVGLNEPQADFSNGRSHFWRIGLKIFLANPIMGAGFDAFGVAFTRFDTWNGTIRVEQAHNDYLQILADAGILGLACVWTFIFLLFRQGTRVIATAKDKFRRSIAVGALAGCFGILIHSFFDFPLRTTSNTFFFLLLAALATVKINKDETSSGL